VTDRSKGKPPIPQVQVIRKGPAPTTPGTVVPTPVAPRPTTSSVVPSPRPLVAPKPRPKLETEGAPEGGAPFSESGEAVRKEPFRPRPNPAMSSRPPGPSFRPRPASPFRAPAAPKSPISIEAMNALAKQERVPARIAKGELEGKMKCRIWKKLHREEASRFDQAYTLMEKHTNLDLAEAFGVVQSGLSVDEFLQKRARVKRKEEVKQARGSVSSDIINAFVESLKAASELAFVLGERTVLDSLANVQPVAFELARTGRVDKLKVVLVTRRSTWDEMASTLTRDPKLAQQPVAVARQPARRPVHDPRQFQEHLGQKLQIVLRNGVTLTEPLHAVGAFDVLVGKPGNELFVPLHGMLSWKVTN
jgi:hypothetical protein